MPPRPRTSPGSLPRLGRLAGAGAALFGPPLATYTAALFSNTAIPVWHEAHRELPFVFGGSAAAAAGGTAMMLAPAAESGPAVRMAGIGAAAELGAGPTTWSSASGCSPSPTRRGWPGG